MLFAAKCYLFSAVGYSCSSIFKQEALKRQRIKQIENCSSHSSVYGCISFFTDTIDLYYIMSKKVYAIYPSIILFIDG